MNELTQSSRQLPDTLPELSKFVLIGRERLEAVKASIRAIDKVGLAKEVHEQKLAEAQELAEAVTDAEVRMGQLLKAIPKATKGSGGNRFQSAHDREISTHVDFSKPKTESIKEAGISQRQAEHFQQMASHPEAVERAKQEARNNGQVLSRSAVLQEIKKPHVVNNSKDDEWYTPPKYIEAAREVLGTIDLDPASNDFANQTVKASTYFTEEINGLEQEWFGNVWMNPPYSTALLTKFADKLVESDISQAIVLVNNATETAWFEKMVSKASAILFHKGRIRFVKRDGEHGAPLQGQAFIYYGDNPERFLEVFSQFGWGATL